MNITPYDPWRMMDEWRKELNRSFGPLLRSDETSQLVTSDWVPAVDIKEEDDRYLLHADIPGVKPEDIEITMENGQLSIRGERKREEKEEKEGYRRVERQHGVFARRFALPEDADAEAISAHGEHGVLEVVIPKRAEAKPKRIEVTH